MVSKSNFKLLSRLLFVVALGAHSGCGVISTGTTDDSDSSSDDASETTTTGNEAGSASSAAGKGAASSETAKSVVKTATNAQMTVPSSLNLIPTANTSAALSAGLLKNFDSLKTEFHVADQSLEVLQLVEAIMCFLHETKFHEHFAAEADVKPVRAMVNEAKCFGEERDSKAKGGGVTLTEVVFEAVRDEGEAGYVHFWISEGDSDAMEVDLNIFTGPTADYPLGFFDMAWIGEGQEGLLMIAEDPEDQEKMRIDIWEEGEFGDENFTSYHERGAIALMDIADSEISGGQLMVYSSQEFESPEGSGSETIDYAIAFDGQYMHKTGTQNGVAVDACVDIDNPDLFVEEYVLFKADGSPVKLDNPGMALVDANGVQFWADFYGIHGPGKIPDDGAKMTGAEDGKTYTVVNRPGRLLKVEVVALTAAKIKNRDMRLWNAAGEEVVVYHDGSAWKKKGTMGQLEDDFGAYEELVELATHTTYTHDSQFMQGFIDGLNHVAVELAADKSTITSVSGRKETDVTGTAEDLTLYCAFDCGQGGLTAAAASAGTISTEPTAPKGSDLTSLRKYTWSKANQQLTDTVAAAVVSVPADASADGRLEHGMETILFDATVAAALGDDVYAAPSKVHYIHTAGHQPWHRYVALKGPDGNVVKFADRLRIDYTHKTANDLNGDATYDGKEMVLYFEGHGHLAGFPDKRDSRTRSRWPSVNLKNGTVLGAASEYKVGLRHVAEVPAVVEDSLCADLSTDFEIEDLPEEDYVEAEKKTEKRGDVPDEIAVKPGKID